MALLPTHVPPQTHFKPSFLLLFKLTSTRELCLFIVPAFAFSIGAGLLSPYVTILLGTTFQALSDFANASTAAQNSDPPTNLDQTRKDFLSLILRISIILFGVAVARVSLNTAGGVFFGLGGESTARKLRRHVFVSVASKPLAWFERELYQEEKKESSSSEDEASNAKQGLGGLMLRFTSEVDDVRIATTTTLTQLTQNITTVLACLVIAFRTSYKLTFVILATVPLIVVFTGLIERFNRPLIKKDKDLSAAAGSRVSQTLRAIPTVKAFRGEEYEQTEFESLSQRSRAAYNKMCLALGARIGVIQVLLLLMFVQGFWFGSYLIKTNELNAGQVTQVFWAALEASGHLQSCVPLLAFLEKGKTSMASLLNLARSSVENFSPDDSHALTDINPSPSCKSTEKDWEMSPTSLKTPPSLSQPSPVIPQHRNKSLLRKAFPASKKHTLQPLRKIRPPTFSGELSLENVTFHYSTRLSPHPPALFNVSLFIPARERTFIVGQSGSGKSTIGSLLMRLYHPDSGKIEADEQDVVWLDEEWLRGQICMVNQGENAIFEGTVHDNVAIGIEGQRGSSKSLAEVSREEVIDACRAALAHEFIINLPEGYDTWLSGEKGADLSGGQRQRLALARAWIRDPAVLIIDEATSALDITSRLLVNEAIKFWRSSKTTVVITHDLTPIEANDFVYVIEQGCVVEQGFRAELEQADDSQFRRMVSLQQNNYVIQNDLSTDTLGLLNNESNVMLANPHQSYLTNVETPEPRAIPTVQKKSYTDTLNTSTLVKASAKRSSMFGELLSPPMRVDSLRKFDEEDHYEPKAQYLDHVRSRHMSKWALDTVERAAITANARRPTFGNRKRVDAAGKENKNIQDSQKSTDAEKKTSYVSLVKVVYSAIPNKRLFYVGLVFCVGSGILPPAFSSLLARLIGKMGTDGSTSEFLKISLFMILVAILEGLSHFLKFSLMQRVAMGWITCLRNMAFFRLLKQPKLFYDRYDNSVNKIAKTVVKDGADAINLVGMIVGQIVSILVIMLAGPIWATVVGYELSLIGFALTPIFVASTVVHARFVVRLEAKNKVLREDLAQKFYETISNIKGIRSMAIENFFIQRIEGQLDKTFRQDCKLASIHGLGYGTGTGLVFLAQGVLYIAGSRFMANGSYELTQVLQVLTLIVFSISFAAQMLSYMPILGKAAKSAIDLDQLSKLQTDTAESEGKMTYPICGNIVFDKVGFGYESSTEASQVDKTIENSGKKLVLRGLSFEVRANECVGIVGPSGCGKSTISALLQRLYEPSEGKIYLDGRDLSRTDVYYVRDCIAVVSQHPTLFDCSVGSNIRYGNDNVGSEVEDLKTTQAAKRANAHDFICNLPKGYDTEIGENSSLLSGGQAQRIAIARALYKADRPILILDEATSALDPSSQDGIMETLQDVKKDVTTVLITHKLAMMKMCDRLIVVQDGKVVETGTFDELVSRHGVFTQLASGGEWGA